SLVDDPVGGLLAMPVSDTVKRAVSATPASVGETVPRAGLWLAQTPQMFRFGLLLDALTRFDDVTDEASAIERAGLSPKLVPGALSNFKVTSAEDLVTMRRLLEGAPARQPTQ
ncbi:MAG TPA: 2-C-methyl-D-erythritol 4-phosphate cytidylyltransferase, partial [Burkholderiaceae bacterium]|nr:2-C-methyl-D-erythritol 4-phosphate cytidylyltransferase [Burkholderiaceae bacterium]